MKRLALLIATGAVALALPAAAQAAPPQQTSVNAAVVGGVLTSTSGTGAVNTVTLTWSFGGASIADSTGASGSPVGAGCGFLSSTSVYCIGATSASVQTLDLADAIVNKSTLPATLDAGEGNDTVTGGTPAETIRGGDGNDVVDAGGGSDTVDAGAGDDQIDVRDGVVDTVDCGAGYDIVQADAGDVVTGCEVGTPVAAETLGGTGKVPGGTNDGSTGPGTDGGTGPVDADRLLSPVTIVGPVTAAVTAGTSVAVSSKGVAKFVLGCAADEPKACTGAIFIDPAPAAKAKGKKAKKSSVEAFMARRGRYGSSPFKVKPGAEGSTQVKLTGVAMRAVGKARGRKARHARRGRRVNAVVTIAPKNTRAQKVKIVLKG